MTPTPTPTRKRKAPPGPLYVVRSHEHSVTQVSLAPTAHHLVSGDDGGGVCITSLRTMRCVRQWAAHSDSVLTLQWLDNYTLLSHGRDNLVKVWSVSGACGDSDDNNDNNDNNDSDDTYTPPPLTHEFHVNALNFCNVSACTVQTQTHAQTQAQTLWVAAPHLADSARVSAKCQVLNGHSEHSDGDPHTQAHTHTRSHTHRSMSGSYHRRSAYTAPLVWVKIATVTIQTVAAKLRQVGEVLEWLSGFARRISPFLLAFYISPSLHRSLHGAGDV